MGFIKSRLSEKWSWVAIFTMVSTFSGLDLTEAQQYAIALFGMVLVGSPDDKINGIFKRKKL